MGDTAQDGNNIFTVVSNFICQKDAEISILPTVILPLNTVSQGTYRVRTLMDTGSMTNWITRALLNFITYTTKGHTLLEVITMTGRERKRFELVDVFYNGKDKVNSLTCYVYDGFAKHVTVKGIPKLLQGQNTLAKEQYDAIVDPASSAVDHAGMSLGIGIIMCPASISKIRCGPTIHFDAFNISLKPTIFGLAISGEVPRVLKDKVNTICNNCTIALQVCSHVTVPKLVQKLTEPLFKTEMQREEELKSKPFDDTMCNAHQVSIDTNSAEALHPSAPVEGPLNSMPFRGFLKLGSNTEHSKCMDDSSKPTALDVSLSQVFYKGPSLVFKLTVLLLKFMKGRCGTVADLERAFLRSVIAASDSDVLRYFWFSDPYDLFSDLVMTFKVVIFRSKASPFHLAAVLHVLLWDDCEGFYFTLLIYLLYFNRILQICIYVDKVVSSERYERKLLKFCRCSKHPLKGSNFDLKQWTSISELLIQQTSLDELILDKVVKVLGMKWMIVNIDIPTLVVSLTEVLIMTNTLIKALAYNLSLTGLDQPWQEYYNYPQKQSWLAGLALTNTDQSLQMVLVEPHTFNMGINTPSTTNGTGFYMQPPLHPNCINSVPVKGDLVGASGKLVTQIFAYIACLLILTLSKQFKGIETDGFYHSFLAFLISLTLLLVVPFITISPLVLKQFKLSGESQYMSDIDLRFGLLPIPLSLDCFPLTMVMGTVTWGSVIILSNAVQNVVNVLLHSLGSIDIASRLAAIGLVYIPVLIGVCRISLAYFICGILAMCFITFLHFIKVFQRNEDFVKIEIKSITGSIVTLLNLLILSTASQIAPILRWAKLTNHKLKLRDDPYNLYFNFSVICLWLHLKETVRIVGSEKVITPNSILMKCSDTNIDILQVTNKENAISNTLHKIKLTPQVLKDIRRFREAFWTHFRQQCLESSKIYYMPAEETPGLTPQVGEVIAIFDPHKLFWSKGFIIELLLSKYGLIKMAVVKVFLLLLIAVSEPNEVN